VSRKYRQPGYQDTERDDERRGRNPPPPPNNLTPEERIQRRSLRHAIDRQANEVVRCHDCGRSVQGLDAISPETTCPHCQAPLHCCRACRHFDSGARWQCRAPITAPVNAKSAANECSHYAPRLVLDTTGRRSNTPQSGGGGPRERFDSLFKR
jgi:hypothetical protein